MAYISEPGHLGGCLRGGLLVHGFVHGRAAPGLQRPVYSGRVRDLLEAAADRGLRAHHPAGQGTLETGRDRPAGILRPHPALAGRHDGDGLRLQGCGRPVPHVDAGRVRGLAHVGDGLHGRGVQGGQLCGLVRVFLVALGGLKEDWQMLLVAVCAATLILGNVVAIVQSNIKRMLAYSSIAHAGYALIGLIVADSFGTASVMLYLAIYAFMTLGAFTVVTMLRRGGLEGDSIDDFTGLAKRNKWAALVMLLFMISLTGIPPTGGFIAKFYIFMAAVSAGMTGLAVLAVIFAAVSAYYYLRVVMVMYMRDPGEAAGTPGYNVRVVTSPATIAVLVVASAAVLILGVFPDQLVKAAQSAILPLR